MIKNKLKINKKKSVKRLYKNPEIKPVNCRIVLIKDIFQFLNEEELKDVNRALQIRSRYDKKISHSLMTISDFKHVVKRYAPTSISLQDKITYLLKPFEEDDFCLIELESGIPQLI